VIEIREAIPADIPGIAAVVRDIWGQDILPDVCTAQIDRDACALWVTAEGEDIAGFISAFLTLDRKGTRRWEIDLLAVRRASQGQRLGQRLVEAACQDAEALHIPVARAAVRVDNAASRKTFQNAGFTTDGEIHKLLLWTPAASNGPSIYGGGVTFVPVDTVTYRGLWLEGLTAEGTQADEQRSAVKMARAIVAWEGWANMGALIPAREEHRLAGDLRDAAKLHGEFCCFLKSMG
jgi:ribosomal protein S18 acetylase RimI-like enzyme